METLSNLSFREVIPYICKDRSKVEGILESYGIKKKIAIYLSNSLEEDWINSKDVTNEIKIWALQRGFLPSRVKLFGLNNDNYRDYLSDIDYFYLHPLNNHFSIWINDKLTLKYIIPSFFYTLDGRHLSIMPEYYLYIENDGRYSYLMDSPKYIHHDDDYLLNLLKDKTILALKPSNGQGGHGFVMLKYFEDKIYANNKELSKDDFDKFKETLNGYIVTEYVKQHKIFDSVWKDSVCTLRIIALRQCNNKYSGGNVNVITSFARFGTAISLGASNLSSGGVGISCDFNTGQFGTHFFQYPKFSKNGSLWYQCHPDTKVSLSGKVLPHWNIVRDVVLSVCDYLSSLEYFGFDLMITDEGVKLCEINTLPSLCGAQTLCGPILRDPDIRVFFENKMKIRKEQ